MSKPQGTAGPSRRSFASVAFGGVAATALFGRETTKEITQASVPGDPIAPKIQPGTVAEQQPFAEIEFRRHDVPLKMTAFALSNVRLLLGVFRDAQEADRALLLRLPADRLLHTFRLNAGLPSSAEPLGGWERPSCELRGHFAGHFLSACALMYASTGDREVKAKGDYMVAELAKCQHKLGGQYLSAFPLELFDRLKVRKEVWAPFYTIHKVMAGMLDMQEHCGNAQALEVLAARGG